MVKKYLSYTVVLSITTVLSPYALWAKTLGTCFGTAGHCDQVLGSWINAAEVSVDGAIYGLTDQRIGEALVRAHRRGVQVRIVHDQSQSREQRDLSQRLMEAGVPIHIQPGSEGGILHDKFIIIDHKYVITGSFNWTNNATYRNDENFVVLDDVVPAFEKEFNRLWNLPPETFRKIYRHRGRPSP